MMEELMSRPAEGADVCRSGSSPDTLQENLVSSSNVSFKSQLFVNNEMHSLLRNAKSSLFLVFKDSTVEEADEESDEDEEVFEDALDQLQGTNLAPSSTF